MKWTVEFRYFSPGHDHVPLMFIPIERTTIEALDRAEAPQAFYDSWDKLFRGHFEILDIWEYRV